MFTRRAFVGAGACALCVHASDAGPSPIFDGCAISTNGYQQFRSQNENIGPLSSGIFARDRHWRTTGDRALDRDLDRALIVTADLFGVNPAFGFYDPAHLQNPR